MTRTLLIVDDIRSNREILKNMLGGEYALTEASDGEEALEILLREHEHISAVLLDVSMPVMDGFQVLRKMRENALLASIPVIMITGSENEEARVKALSYGANDFVMKPYSSEIIKHCLHNNIAFREAATTVDALRRDKVTGLYNREAFFERVRVIVSEREPGYYIMASFDIDKFKVVNDQYGSVKGDEVLRHVAGVFAAGFEPHGGLCCRISADNFAVLYPAAFQDTEDIAEIRREASSIDGIIFPIAFSIGRYIIDDVTLEPAAMYDRAVLAARLVKGRYGEKIGVYTEEMRERLLHEQEIVTEMEFALKDRQFEVWFQPQYNHSTDALIGAEALVRWRHPQKGLIPPSDFIPIFEQNGFVYELDRFVWEEVCRYLKKWQNEGRSPLPVSVNVSRYDVFQSDVVETICALVRRYGLPADMLRLEVTESAFAESAEHVVGIVRELIDCGFTVEIDDFGSAYSSLNTLKDVPAQILKLDMKFFENSGDSQRGGNIVESVVRMAKWLGMSVIAEGVETLAQANFLRSVGCNYIQGYLYAKPMSAPQYEAYCGGSEKEEKLLVLETVENLDSSSFWDAKSMDTLIFNSYVGAACIFEYCNGEIEVIRATEKYAQIIGSAEMTVEDALKINWSNHLADSCKERLISVIEESIRTKKEITGEYIFLDLPGCPHETYLRTTMRVIATAGNRSLVYCTNENITAQKHAEQREREVSEQLKAIMHNLDSGVSASILVDGRLCPIFANDSYFRQLGYTREEYENQFEGLPMAVLPEDREMVMERAMEINTSMRPGSVEFRVRHPDGSVHLLKSNIALMDYPSISEPVQLSVTTDITAEREAESEIRRLSQQMQAIMDNVDLGIIAAVLENGTARYLFANEHYYKMLGYTEEQFNAEIASPYQTIAEEDRQMVVRRTEELNRSGGSIALEYIARTRNNEKRAFRAIISIGTLSGVDAPVQLSILRDITEEKELEQREREAAARLQNMMDDMPGGFVRIRVYDDGGLKPVYFNKGFYKLTGMDHDELMALYADDAMSGVHPEDVGIVKRAVAEMLEHGEARSARYRLRHSGGGYIWLMIFGRVTTGADGEVYLNIYYSDATQEIKAEEQSKELLDNLPYGAALYAFDGERLSAVHLNKRYWELVGRGETEYAGDNFLGVVSREDRSVISRELELAIRERRDIACDVRILCGDGTYSPFHIVGRILPGDDGARSIYAVYTPITDEAMSVQEMLPIALSAMMDTQTDYSFVKDKNLRYICCSRGAAQLAGLSSAEDIEGKTDGELFEGSLAEEFTSEDVRVIENGEASIETVTRLPSADGAVRYASTSKYPLKDASGRIVGLYGIGRDITENRIIRSQYELLTSSIPGGVATYEVRGGDMRVAFFSDGFCELFGLTREECSETIAKNVYAGVFEEDLPQIKRQLEDFLENDAQVDCVFRVRLPDGGYKWINLKAASAEREEDCISFNAVLFDITQRQSSIENLRISEEENRLAMQHTSNTICRYDVASSTLRIPQRAQDAFQLPELAEDIPDSQIRRGLISPDTAETYRAFYDGIRNGSESGSAIYQRLNDSGWRWVEGHYSTIFSADHKPVSAVISFADVTERIEKDAAYTRWKQSLLDRRPESYSLFRYNISTGKYINVREGRLISFDFEPGTFDFNGNTDKYASECVYPEDAESFMAEVNTDTLLAGYYRGKRMVTLEYRQLTGEKGYRWLRLTIELVELPGSSDIEAYMLFEDIDAAKRREMDTIEQAQTDPLTGALNRTTFAARVEDILQSSAPETQHAFMMLDIDCFKQVNDAFGHSTGDQALIDTADTLRLALRRDDLICRMGGDEFLVFLADIPGDSVAAAKARQIGAAMRKALSAEVEISGSIGIAIVPRDGRDFDTLYKKADAALYHVKGSGKDSFAFYQDDMADQHLTLETEPAEPTEATSKKKKRRMLIVDDNRIDHALLSNIFAEDFIIEKAKNGSDALIRLRHYGAAISVVLLDLMMPGMDGFAVLRVMQESAELQSVPVIVVSGDESRETNLRAIRSGAVDFVSKPVDPEILRIRVESAISKAENERLRAKNSYLEFQNSEVIRYRTALENSGVVTIENDWVAGTFIYDPTMSRHIAGKYDERGFWHILLSDFVAETLTVQKMQNLVQEVAADRMRQVAQLDVRLKTPENVYHWFRMNVNKKLNEFDLAGKIYMTFVDLETSAPAI